VRTWLLKKKENVRQPAPLAHGVTAVMFPRLLSLCLFLGCGPAEDARVRVLNATIGDALDVEVAGVAVASSLRFGEVSPFTPVASGAVPATVLAGTSPLFSTTLALSPGATQTLLLAPEPFLLTHASASPVAGLIHVRLFNGLGERASVELGDAAFSLEARADSGAEGIGLPAGRRSPLVLSVGPERLRFTVPALPEESEVLLVATRQGAPVLLAVAPSAALGVLRAEQE
jgi:hypothetical protein